MDRRFVSWDAEEGSALERLSAPLRNLDAVPWSELRKLKRVVLLAEAGSGKSAELKEQARAATAEGAYGFYTEVKELAREGLAPSLGAANRVRSEAWNASTQPGWFFVDALDEAKLDHVRLRAALEKLADALGPDLRRAHIFLSGLSTGAQYGPPSGVQL